MKEQIQRAIQITWYNYKKNVKLALGDIYETCLTFVGMLK